MGFRPAVLASTVCAGAVLAWATSQAGVTAWLLPLWPTSTPLRSNKGGRPPRTAPCRALQSVLDEEKETPMPPVVDDQCEVHQGRDVVGARSYSRGESNEGVDDGAL